MGEEGEPLRGHWDLKFQFFFACVGYAVGLGNVWRFPYLVYRNGGGCFLVPYFLMAMIVGLPMFLVEIYMGQFCGVGPTFAYTYIAPFFQGLGYCVTLVIGLVTVYYMVILAWIIFYFFASFNPTLPWSSCSNAFNSQYCYSNHDDGLCRDKNPDNITIYWNRKCTLVDDICAERNLVAKNDTFCIDTGNDTLVPLNEFGKRVLATEDYYYTRVLGQSGHTWASYGFPQWELVLCLLLSWVIAFLCLIKGLRNAGRVVYFTAIFPYVILTILLIRGCTLDGAGMGIRYYLKPDWEKLMELRVWGDAASQIFYSFGLSNGSLIAYAAYNQFQNNFHRDVIYVSITNLFTCIYSGFSVFAILGFMAYTLNESVNDVVKDGPGLAFIVYPEAILLMPWPQLWAVLFFLMMFILGMGSEFGGIETICSSITDKWPHLRESQWKITGGVCLSCFILGIPMTCNSGVFLFTLLEWNTASWAILLLGFSEVIVVSWIYGMDNFFEDLVAMGIALPTYCKIYWKVLLIVLTPIASLFIFAFIVTDIPGTEFRDYSFPIFANLFGWLIGILTLVPFVGFSIYRVQQNGWSFKGLFTPTSDWKPQSS